MSRLEKPLPESFLVARSRRSTDMIGVHDACTACTARAVLAFQATRLRHRRELARLELGRLARLVSRINRALGTESYRRGELVDIARRASRGHEEMLLG